MCEGRIDAVPDPVELLGAAVDALASQRLSLLSAEELTDQVVALQAEQARLAAAEARVIGEWNARRAWATDGSVSGTARLAAATRAPVSSCRMLVRLARKLRAMPHTRAALEAGDITPDHARRLERANRARFRSMFARDEQLLVELATKTECWIDFHREITYWEQLADDNAAEADAEGRHAGRYLSLSQTLDGRWRLDANLDPIGGTEVDTVLRDIERDLFEADWAAAVAQYGAGNVTPDKLGRTSAQRRADAIVEMARRAAAMAPGARKPAPLVTVLVSYETLIGRICELYNKTVVTPGQIARLLDEAEFERVVFNPAGRPIDIGRRQRLFTGATRRAVEILDRTCTHEAGCDVPADQCDIDHIKPYSDGGETIVDNGRARCPPHNPNRRRPITTLEPDQTEPPVELPTEPDDTS